MTVLLAELSSWLARRLSDTRLIRDGPPEVPHLGLALDPRDLPADLPGGAVFLHRVHQLGAAFPGLAVFNSHDVFDVALTTGPNLPLAETLRWHEVERVELEQASGLIALPRSRTGSVCSMPFTPSSAAMTRCCRPGSRRCGAWP